MAHNIMMVNGRGAVALNHTAAWHNLGTVVNGAMTWVEAMDKALLNWEVEKHQLLSSLTGTPVEAWGMFKMNGHEGHPVFLGAVGNNYTAIQNKFAFDFVDAILEADCDAHYEAAGALGNGERIWCLAKVNGETRIQGTNDVHQHYLLFATSHDGSMAATCKLTTVRVVCQNTLTSALNQAGSFMRVKHTAQASDRLEAAKKLIMGVKGQIGKIEEKFNELAHRKVTKDSFTAVMKKVFGDFEDSARVKNQVLEVAKLFESNDRNAIPEIKGTAYNLLNAITEYEDHVAGFRRTDRREGMSPNAIRSENALFGIGASLKEKALEVITLETANDPRLGAKSIQTNGLSPLLNDILNATPSKV
jgi:phage/plasmid-like protein (TIGR03299 family)